jgi:predicted KAP-like P-loop ATPase
MIDPENLHAPYNYDDHPEKDEFQRRGFAKRVVETILAQPLGKCLVVSIVGHWGSGKSTVLNYIHEENSSRKASEGTCQIAPFNPWRFAGEEALLYELMEALVKAIDPNNSVLTEWQKLQDRIARVSSPVGKWLTIPLNWIFPSIGTILSSALDSFKAGELRKRMDGIRRQAVEHLKVSRKRVVVLLDDIDRLEADDLMLLLKSIKLIADLPNTTFVIAMDEKNVCKVIGSRNGYSPKSARKYIEKIVNVRLGLPVIPPSILAEHTLKLLSETIRRADGFLPSEDTSRVRSIFLNLHAPFIKTPRTAKSIQNAVSFALGLLGKELNAGDVVLLEATRLLHPKLYLAIQDVIPSIGASYEYFPEDHRGDNTEKEKRRLLRWKILLKDFEGLNDHQKKPIQDAIRNWFPQFYESSDEESKQSWELERRICSRSYFWRYFTGAILEDDVRDEEVLSWIQLPHANQVDSTGQLKQHLERKYARVFLAKLKTFCNAQTQGLERVLNDLAAAGSQLPDTDEGLTGNIKTRSAESAARLIELLPQERREKVVLEMLHSSQDLGWSFCLWSNITDEVLDVMSQQKVDEGSKISRVDLQLAHQSLARYEAGELPDTNEMIKNMAWAISRNISEQGIKSRLEALVVKNPAIALQMVITGCGFGHSEQQNEACWIWHDNSCEKIARIISPGLMRQALLQVLPVKREEEPSGNAGHRYQTLSQIGWRVLDTYSSTKAG